jgi:HEAT repeat protein
VSPLIETLQTPDPGLVLYSQHILARIPSATSALTKTLASAAHPLVRGRVAEVFGINKDNSAIPALVEALKDRYFEVRSQAVLALGNIGDARAIPLIKPFLQDEEAEVRSAACIALTKFHEPSVFDEIANVMLDDPIIEVRHSAAMALGNTKHLAAIPFLMEALRDSSWWFERDEAAADLLTAIEKMGPAVVDPLIEALGDKEGTVRRYAAVTLGRIGDLRAIEELGMTLYDLHNEVRKAAGEALAKFGAPAVDIFIEALKHPEAEVRENAVVAMGKVRDPRVGLVLIEMLHDPVRDVRRQAMITLGELRDQRALPDLQEIVSNRADRELSMLAKQVIDLITKS